MLKKQADTDLGRQLAKSEKILSRVNDELAQYRKSAGRDAHDKLHPIERRIRQVTYECAYANEFSYQSKCLISSIYDT